MFSIQKGEFVEVLHDSGPLGYASQISGTRSMKSTTASMAVVYPGAFVSKIWWICHKYSEVIINTKPIQKQSNTVALEYMHWPLQPAYWIGLIQRSRRIPFQIYVHIFFSAFKTGTWKSFPKRPQQGFRESGLLLVPLSTPCAVTAACPGDQLRRGAPEWQWRNAELCKVVPPKLWRHSRLCIERSCLLNVSSV